MGYLNTYSYQVTSISDQQFFSYTYQQEYNNTLLLPLRWCTRKLQINSAELRKRVTDARSNRNVNVTSTRYKETY